MKTSHSNNIRSRKLGRAKLPLLHTLDNGAKHESSIGAKEDFASCNGRRVSGTEAGFQLSIESRGHF